MKKNVIRIGPWSIYLDLDIISSKDKHMRFSSFKEDMIENQPDLVEKYRLRSTFDGVKIEKKVAWDSLVEEADSLGLM